VKSQQCPLDDVGDDKIPVENRTANCVAKLANLPVSINGHYDGYMSSCFALHAPYVANLAAEAGSAPTMVTTDDNNTTMTPLASHCAHLSFAPVADANGQVKCQSSSTDLLDANLWSASDLEAFAAYVTKRWPDVDPKTAFVVKSMSTIPPTMPKSTPAPAPVGGGGQNETSTTPAPAPTAPGKKGESSSTIMCGSGSGWGCTTMTAMVTWMGAALLVV